jgi:hypothetical protein
VRVVESPEIKRGVKPLAPPTAFIELQRTAQDCGRLAKKT